jgi:hypothetical protein
VYSLLKLSDRKMNGDGSYEDDDGEYMYVSYQFHFFQIIFFLFFCISTQHTVLFRIPFPRFIILLNFVVFVLCSFIITECVMRM